MNRGLDYVRSGVRSFMRSLAKLINHLSGERITPSMVTIFGFLAHLPIAYLIAVNQYVLAGILLIIFGLFDALDGELARLQGKASNAGMLLDATTDRMKEVILYVGVVYSLLSVGDISAPTVGALVVAACGGSLLVSYVKAKGETAIKDKNLTPNEINRLFQDGLLRFEIRMFLLIVGLFSGQLVWAVGFIAAFSWLTAFGRLQRLLKKVADV